MTGGELLVLTVVLWRAADAAVRAAWRLRRGEPATLVVDATVERRENEVCPGESLARYRVTAEAWFDRPPAGE